MSKFYIGIRADEIVSITKSKSTEFPTEYLLRNGHTFQTTGDWQENVKRVEKILEESANTAAELESREHELRVRIEAHERVLARLKGAGPVQDDDAALLVGWMGSGRNYLVAHERESLARLLGTFVEAGS